MAAGRIETFIKDNYITFPTDLIVTTHAPIFNENRVVAQSAQEVVELVEKTHGLAKIVTADGEHIVIYPQFDGVRPLFLLRLPQNAGEGFIWSDCNNFEDFDLAFGAA